MTKSQVCCNAIELPLARGEFICLWRLQSKQNIFEEKKLIELLAIRIIAMLAYRLRLLQATNRHFLSYCEKNGRFSCGFKSYWITMVMFANRPNSSQSNRFSFCNAHLSLNHNSIMSSANVTYMLVKMSMKLPILFSSVIEAE